MTPAEYIGGRIRFLRKLRKLTQTQLAEDVGISRENLTGIESGTRGEPKLGTLLRFARALGVTVSTLTDGLEEQITTDVSEKQRQAS